MPASGAYNIYVSEYKVARTASVTDNVREALTAQYGSLRRESVQ
jgi:hypothetical protein